LQVVLAGLELANALVASDASVMETMCLVGIVPTVARFATASWARGIRLQAALFVQQLCRTSLATAQMFVACQVQPPALHCLLGVLSALLSIACCAHAVCHGGWQSKNGNLPLLHDDKSE